jgi:bifunctional UDP-N-acetylglucosamine pyrophosphorylase / glucosamine-1-phosphate N-acetyltransferase
MMAADNVFDVVILAAGKGTRLKSELPKVLHPLFGKPLIERVLGSLQGLPVGRVYVILGHGRQAVEAHLNSLRLPFEFKTIVQEPQLGTGHALMQAKKHLGGEGRNVLVLSGDVPLLRPETLVALLNTHHQNNYALSLLAARLADPAGYGRLVVDSGQLRGIVEEKDASDDQKRLDVVNAGIYCLAWPAIAPLLDQLSSANAQEEFYLTDIVGLATQENLNLGYLLLDDAQEMLGVNDRADLAVCHQVLNRRAQMRWMAEGVTILDPDQTLIGPDVTLGPDTVIYPGTFLLEEISVGRGCVIGPHTTMSGQVRVGNRSSVVYAVVRDSQIGPDTQVGPFAHLRDGAVLANHVRIGNFVEVKNTTIDHHSNAAHLAYLGDARLGSEVNMGAGSITANYDPIRDEKHVTVIEDGVKVGCNAVLVAPVTLHQNASVAAGSVITQNVTPWSLAIARPRQSEIKHWVARIKGVSV